MTFPIKPGGFFKKKGPTEFIALTIEAQSAVDAGINLTFASGILTIDWGDGAPTENFVSGVELIHTYTSTRTRGAIIYGDLINITKFIADNSRISFIAGLKTGLLTEFKIQNNLYVGELDMSLAPVSGTFWTFSNSSLTSITFATSGNAIVSDLRTYSCNLSSLVLSNVPIQTTLFTHLNPNLASITFATSGNGTLSNLIINSCNLSSLDFTNVPISTKIDAFGNPNLASMIFASSGNGTLSNLRIDSCNLSSLDFTNVPVGGSFWVQNNSSLSSMTFAGSGNSLLTFFRIGACSMPNVDFSVFPTSDNASFFEQSNSFTATEHDNQLINLDATGWINGTLQIITGNTARTSASDAAHANLLVNGWTII